MAVSKCVTGIQHVGIPTKDIEKTIDFFTKLGFEIILQTVNEATSQKVAFLQLKNLTIETYESSSASGSAGAIDHIALDVDDIEMAFKTINLGGFKVLDSEIQSLPFFEHGVRFFTIEGPNAEKVEFSQKL